jgi:zinc transport system ATP-binding protein
MKTTPPIQIQDLTFSYGRNPIVEQVNLTVEDREFVCVVGPNGGGKTTLLKLLLGLLEPQSGRVKIFGNHPKAGRKQIGYLPQHAELDPQFPATVLDVVLMGRLGKTRVLGPYRKADRRLTLDMLERVGLHQFANRPLCTLSGGQRQRVLIARALVSEPQLLLLDEPTSSLDDYVERELYDLLKEINQTLTVVVVTHDIAFVSRYIEKVICVNRKVRIHPTSEVNENMIHDMYGEHVHAVRHDQEHHHD